MLQKNKIKDKFQLQNWLQFNATILLNKINNIIYFENNKVQLQNWLQLKDITSLNKINITIYFENLTIELYIFYTFNTHVKLCVNQMLFTIYL